jgi:hypothetical protein
LSLFLLILVSLAACQPNSTPSPIGFNPPANTPNHDQDTPEDSNRTVTPPPINPSQAKHTPTPTPNNCLQDGGEIRSASFSSEHLAEDFYFQVYLPPCYHDQCRISATPSPICCMAYTTMKTNGFEWVLLSKWIAWSPTGEIPPFIIILPREARFHPPQTSAFDNALIEELIPWVDQHYRTLAEKPYRAIGGLSRGAAWAVRIGFEHYQLFDSIGAHSLPLFEADGGRLNSGSQASPRKTCLRFILTSAAETRKEPPPRTSLTNWIITMSRIHGIVQWRAHRRLLVCPS